MRTTLYSRVLLLLATLGFAQSVWATQMCQFIFLEGREVQPRLVDFGLLRDSGRSERIVPIEIVKYKEIKSDLQAVLAKTPAERRKDVEHLLDAVEFFDYSDTATSLLPNLISGKKETFDFSNLYDSAYYRREKKGAAFNGFLSAREYLKKQKPDVTADLILGIHKRIMKNGVEDVAPADLGLWRNVSYVGNVRSEWRITPKELAAIESNPYLYFSDKVESKERIREGVWKDVRIWGRQKNMGLELGDTTLIEGLIVYPHIFSPKAETFELIKKSHPAVYKKIQEFRTSKTRKSAKDIAALEAEYTEALVQERFARFNADRKALGTVKIGINEHKYIDLVADFQSDLVAIHPLLNGNGRSTRLFMNYLLTREGLPPVRLVDPSFDMQVSRTEWREYVHKAVVNNSQLYADVLTRVKNGLTVEYSPELIYPGLPETVSVALKKQGSKEIVNESNRAKVESEQFNAFIKTMVAQYPELKIELKNNQMKTMSRLADLFVEYYRSKTIRYIHEKDGERQISLRLVDPDFIDLFGQSRSYSKELWDYKIDRWYERDMLVWRGLADKKRVYKIEELLEYFKAPSTHLASNRVIDAVYRGKNIVKAMKEDFDLYNKEMLTGDVVEMAMDHHKTGPRYGTSYGFSTSKREVVGKAFAMGAMVVAEYGKHMDPAAQAKLKDRILIAAFRSTKDVDLGRLKQFDSDFNYEYGRQAEVMGIGGTDADAVMIVQRLNAQGEVIQSLVRNIEKPNEVFLIEGRYVPEEGPLDKSRIVKTFQLSKKK